MIAGGATSCASAPKYVSPSKAIIVSKGYIKAADSLKLTFSPKRKGVIIAYREGENITVSLDTSSLKIRPLILNYLDKESYLYPKVLRIDAYEIEDTGSTLIKIRNKSKGLDSLHYIIVYDPSPSYIHEKVEGWGRLKYGIIFLLSFIFDRGGQNIWTYTTYDSLSTGVLGIATLVCHRKKGPFVHGDFNVARSKGIIDDVMQSRALIISRYVSRNIAFYVDKGGIYKYYVNLYWNWPYLGYLGIALWGLDFECNIVSYTLK